MRRVAEESRAITALGGGQTKDPTHNHFLNDVQKARKYESCCDAQCLVSWLNLCPGK